MDYGAIAAGAAGLTSGVIGSVWGQKESKQNRREARRQFNVQMDESVQRRVSDALKAGINPLAALGYNGGASPTVHVGGGSSGVSDSIYQAGQGLSKVLQGAFADKQADDMEFDSQAKELDLEHQRLENQYLRNQIAAQTQIPGVDLESPPSMEGEGTIFTPVYDLHGRPRLVVNQNFLEGDSDNAGYSAALASALADGQIDKITGEVVSPQLRMMIDDYYYNTTGHHIHNLDKLYISPTEIALANANAAEQSGIFSILKHVGKYLFLRR